MYVLYVPQMRSNFQNWNPIVMLLNIVKREICQKIKLVIEGTWSLKV